MVAHVEAPIGCYGAGRYILATQDITMVNRDRLVATRRLDRLGSGKDTVGELDRSNQAGEFAAACLDSQVVSVCDREGAVQSGG